MNNLKILITGDTHLGGGRIKGLAQDGAKAKLFGSFLNLIQEADIAVTNLESPVINDGTPNLKTGPNLKSPVDALKVLADSGFNLLTLANNHIMDYDVDGLNSTIAECKKLGLHTVGAGQNFKEAAKPYIQNVNGLTIGLLNIAENEFGTTFNSKPGCHGMDPIKNYYTILETSKNVDFLIVIVHGGHEHYELPSPRMKSTYRFFVDAGADAVISHHTHCISGFEIYKEAPIFYGLGNFLFDEMQSKKDKNIDPWNIGILLELYFFEEKIDFKYYPYIQNNVKPGLIRLNRKESSNFEKKIKQLNSIIRDDELLQKCFYDFCRKKSNSYKSYIEPHSIRILHSLQNHNLLPSFLTNRKKLLMLNVIRCESHRDVLLKNMEL